jgi:transcriptional regulator with XRE-family HTH domain
MERRTVARALRALRRRKRWSQRQLGSRLGISQSELSRRERSALDACSLDDVERWATALGAHLSLDLRADGERPLVDARHAALQSWLVDLLRGHGWSVEPEVSFNHYGDRGRVDVLAYHPLVRVLAVTEIKSWLEDEQETLGRLDVKRRIATHLARDRGWEAHAITPVLLFADGRTARRRVADHGPLFAHLELRGRAAIGWLRAPALPAPRGILAFVSLSS